MRTKLKIKKDIILIMDPLQRKKIKSKTLIFRCLRMKTVTNVIQFLELIINSKIIHKKKRKIKTSNK